MLKKPSPPLIESVADNNHVEGNLLQLALVMDATESMSIWLKRTKD